MGNESRVDGMKEMIAEAIMLGIKLSEHDYEKVMEDSGSFTIKKSIDRLKGAINQHLDEVNASDISVEQVLPLYSEIQEVIKTNESKGV